MHSVSNSKFCSIANLLISFLSFKNVNLLCLLRKIHLVCLNGMPANRILELLTKWRQILIIIVNAVSSNSYTAVVNVRVLVNTASQRKCSPLVCVISKGAQTVYPSGKYQTVLCWVVMGSAARISTGSNPLHLIYGPPWWHNSKTWPSVPTVRWWLPNLFVI